MHKKITSRILLGLTLTTSLTVFAVSCHSKPTSTELNDEANKVMIDYPSKGTLLSKEAVEKSFVFSGYNDKKFKISLTSVMPDDRYGQAIINFKLVYLMNENEQSDTKEIKVSGFKKVPLTERRLEELASKIEFDYPDKANVYPWEVKLEKITFKNMPPNTIISNTKIEDFFDDKVKVAFIIRDEFNPETIVDVSLDMFGLKTLNRDYSEITKIIFGNPKGLIWFQLDDWNRSILRHELFKPGGEILFNFNTNLLVVPLKGKTFNLADSKTFGVVGWLDKSYKTLYNKLLSEITKLISDNLRTRGFDFYSLLTKLFTSTKEEAVEEFEKQKSTLVASEETLSPRVDFKTDYVKNLEKLVSRENFSIIYNPKTGLFTMQAGEEEIDRNKPSTFNDLIEFKENFREQISEKMKELLSQNQDEKNILDTFLTNPDYKLEFIFQKSDAKFTLGLRIKHTPTSMDKPTS